MYRRVRIFTASCLAAVGVAAAAQAAEPQLELVEQPADRFERSIEAHKLDQRYRGLLADARKLDAEPAEHLLDDADVTAEQLRAGIDALSERVRKAEREARAEGATGGDFALAGGVSLATLNAIAACESGGDPTAVNPAGYYGKYQFDTGTWASVGGSGNPAEASEAEQDYRASLLYSQAGSSPWPVCGV